MGGSVYLWLGSQRVLSDMQWRIIYSLEIKLNTQSKGNQLEENNMTRPYMGCDCSVLHKKGNQKYSIQMNHRVKRKHFKRKSNQIRQMNMQK